MNHPPYEMHPTKGSTPGELGIQAAKADAAMRERMDKFETELEGMETEQVVAILNLAKAELVRRGAAPKKAGRQ